MAVDPALLLGWMTARSIGRGLPAPVAELGGFRVDTGSETEACRWAFPDTCDGLSVLGRKLAEPRHAIQLCGSGETLLGLLDARWRPDRASHFMQRPGASAAPIALPTGYALRRRGDGVTSGVEVLARDGRVAASGFAVEAAGVFIYDRIHTEPEHRRNGLGRAVMIALGEAKVDAAMPELLTATAEGHALYKSLGWVVLSPYATAEIVAG
jgi:GNAT superfamily N-acetyltransferase